jgi:hypothetical protein
MMVPLDPLEPGNLESLCVPAAKSVSHHIATSVETFAALLHTEGWAETRKGKLWLRAYLAASCEPDPFVFLSKVFWKHPALIPANHNSFNQVAGVLRGFT